MPTPTHLPADQRDYAKLNLQFESMTLDDRLRWAVTNFGDKLIQVTSFAPAGVVILDHLVKICPRIHIATIDTGFLFDETYAFWERIERAYGIRLIVIKPALSPTEQDLRFGPALWGSNPDACCYERKVKPMVDALTGYHAWITGLRRDQSLTRNQTLTFGWDLRYHLFKLSPLANWTRDQVWGYIHQHNLPYNPLHDQGYASIGCTHCTRLPTDATDERSGRWQGRQKTECGLHLPDQPVKAKGPTRYEGVKVERVNTYPINLVLQDKLVILIGARGEIVHKIPGLLDAGARVRVIAPDADAAVHAAVAVGEIEWLPRRYCPGDLAGAALIFAATGNKAIHDQIWAEGQTNRQLVNVMDVLDRCNFHGVSILRRGKLTIAIGTGGAAPALAVTLRRRFEADIGPEYGEFLDYAQRLRPVVQQRLQPFRRRVQFWYALVESDAIGQLRRGDRAGFDQTVEALLDDYSSGAAITVAPAEKAAAIA